MKQVEFIRTVIVDDERIGREMLLKQGGRLQSLNFIGEADGVQTGVALIQELQPDLVILDIKLQDGTGFDLLEKCTFRDFDVIFVTAFDQYALKAFQYSAVDYLLKPVELESLEAAIERVTQRKSNTFLSQKLTALLSNTKQLKKLAIPTLSSVEIVRIEDIVRLEGDRNYTTIYLINGTQILSSKTLKEYDQTLSGATFFRVHKSHLVNLDKVERFLQTDGGRVVMEGGKEVEVARRRKDDLLRELVNQ